MQVASGAIGVLEWALGRVTGDPRVLALLIAWFFALFMEGAAGFGTPAAVAVPLLVGLGFPGMAAVTAGMIIQSTPVSFGAAGTPILVGVNTGLSGDAGVQGFAAALGYTEWTEFLALIGAKVNTQPMGAGMQQAAFLARRQQLDPAGIVFA